MILEMTFFFRKKSVCQVSAGLFEDDAEQRGDIVPWDEHGKFYGNFYGFRLQLQIPKWIWEW